MNNEVTDVTLSKKLDTYLENEPNARAYISETDIMKRDDFIHNCCRFIENGFAFEEKDPSVPYNQYMGFIIQDCLDKTSENDYLNTKYPDNVTKLSNYELRNLINDIEKECGIDDK